MPNSPNTSYNVTGITQKGGRVVAIKRVNYDGSAIASENWFDLGAKSKTTIMFNRTRKPVEDEAGKIVAYETETDKVEFKIELLQTDSATMNFFNNDPVLNYYAIVCHMGTGLGTTTRFVGAPVTQFDIGSSVSFPGGTFEFIARPQAVNSTWNMNSLTGGSVTAWASNYGLGSNPSTVTGSLTGTATDYFKWAEA